MWPSFLEDPRRICQGTKWRFYTLPCKGGLAKNRVQSKVMEVKLIPSLGNIFLKTQTNNGMREYGNEVFIEKVKRLWVHNWPLDILFFVSGISFGMGKCNCSEHDAIDL